MRMRAFARPGTVIRLGLAGALAVLMLLTTACETRFNLAASVGSTRIETGQLEAFTNRSLNALASTGQPIAADKKPAFQRSVLALLVRESLLTQAAKARGITVTDSEVASVRSQAAEQAGGEQQFEDQLKQSGFAAQDVDMIVRENVLVNKLNVTDTAGLTKLLSAASEKFKVRINPRFGKWDASKATIADTNDLSTTITRT